MNEVNLKISNPSKHINKVNPGQLNLSVGEKQKLAKATQEFESLLTGMMLKSMTKSSGMFGSEGYGGDVLDTVFESEMASYISKSKSFGIAESLFRKMTGEELSEYRMHSIKPAAAFKPEANEVKINTSAHERIKKFDPIIDEASKKYGINSGVIKSIIMAESAGNQNALSKAKAKGLMQLMDGTAKDMGVKNVWDPVENINGGTKYFSKMLRLYDGDIRLALAAYNAGPKNVEKYNGIPPFDETKHYVSRVMNYIENLED
ncbi:MAG: transglycosylase SLT domain-containing protein [Melioribacteraceae bacterium]|nr:transglycosylase SLT domain-containing protein [Melioribacteraceae bacterium]MCF8355159.1 transglycosylase SLT domain-containing protein [Melioribacteraceae bacterium]MCF8392488.1 transglycosylase SLT domain-containing protein [Melioribacteraceae bacterium]MCF8418399.1 transglycosylase SLT domain-containing protein [Melioribacteraceae bacterium]